MDMEKAWVPLLQSDNTATRDTGKERKSLLLSHHGEVTVHFPCPMHCCIHHQLSREEQHPNHMPSATLPRMDKCNMLLPISAE